MFRAMLFGLAAAVAVSSGAQADAGDAAAGAQVFQRCSICHSVTPGAGSTIGPHLNGVIGRQAGSVQGYQYSKAMTASGLTWSKTNLDKFLAGPQALVQGTKMSFMGLPNAKDRANVIAYLATTKK
ncbi:MAG TPA: cytochrome c family protein [Phenylobacterium sp.]|uniref:c-type cytochrome n=1 Tax=Phenylobacterium sp. TaxID=1871053 RepID=UPI002B4903AD|nr:cytochrome c family protein [Phenylobacterium sp.]HKR87130.1 cytochrome c family protein [Phenylobacterium sp.]HKT53379.1 cytochrome c family protein [Caulobacteraceae bacterium]